MGAPSSQRLWGWEWPLPDKDSVILCLLRVSFTPSSPSHPNWLARSEHYADAVAARYRASFAAIYDRILVQALIGLRVLLPRAARHPSVCRRDSTSPHWKSTLTRFPCLWGQARRWGWPGEGKVRHVRRTGVGAAPGVEGGRVREILFLNSIPFLTGNRANLLRAFMTQSFFPLLRRAVFSIHKYDGPTFILFPKLILNLPAHYGVRRQAQRDGALARRSQFTRLQILAPAGIGYSERNLP